LKIQQHTHTNTRNYHILYISILTLTTKVQADTCLTKTILVLQQESIINNNNNNNNINNDNINCYRQSKHQNIFRS